jgi:hypothetical protein
MQRRKGKYLLPFLPMRLVFMENGSLDISGKWTLNSYRNSVIYLLMIEKNPSLCLKYLEKSIDFENSNLASQSLHLQLLEFLLKSENFSEHEKTLEIFCKRLEVLLVKYHSIQSKNLEEIIIKILKEIINITKTKNVFAIYRREFWSFLLGCTWKMSCDIRITALQFLEEIINKRRFMKHYASPDEYYDSCDIDWFSIDLPNHHTNFSRNMEDFPGRSINEAHKTQTALDIRIEMLEFILDLLKGLLQNRFKSPSEPYSDLLFFQICESVADFSFLLVEEKRKCWDEIFNHFGPNAFWASSGHFSLSRDNRNRVMIFISRILVLSPTLFQSFKKHIMKVWMHTLVEHPFKQCAFIINAQYVLTHSICQTLPLGISFPGFQCRKTRLLFFKGIFETNCRCFNAF